MTCDCLFPIARSGRVLKTPRLADAGVDRLILVGRTGAGGGTPCRCSRLRLLRRRQRHGRARRRSLLEWARLLLAPRRGPFVVLLDPVERLAWRRQRGDWRRGRWKDGLLGGRRGRHRRGLHVDWGGT